MFSLIELLHSFIIAIGFIFLLKLHREIFPKSYFASSNLISDIEVAPSLRSVVIRFLLILLYGVILNVFIRADVVILGITLGSFLIVWPIFLSDENVEKRLLEKKLLLRSLLVLFIATTYITAKLSVIFYNLGNEFIHIYLQNYNKEKILILIGDSLIWTGFALFLNYIYSHIRKVLNRKLFFSNSPSNKKQETFNSYDEVAADMEPINEEENNNA